MFDQILCNPEPIINFSINMGTMSKTLMAIEQLYFFNNIWHNHNLFLRPPKTFLGLWQDISPNITQPRTNRKFLLKYGYNVKILRPFNSFNFFKKIWHYHHLFLGPTKYFLGPYQDVVQILHNPEPIINFSINMGIMSKTLTAIEQLYFLKKICH